MRAALVMPACATLKVLGFFPSTTVVSIVDEASVGSPVSSRVVVFNRLFSFGDRILPSP
jgi:hypothetical protein